MCRISVDLDIEDVSTTCECVVRSLDLCLVLRSTLEVYRHMVGVCIVILVCDARDDAELLLVATCEAACKALSRSSEHAVVVLVSLAELVDLASHEGNDAESEFLCLCRFSVVLADEGDECLCESDESDTECSVVDYSLDCVVVSKLLAVKPKRTHQERELLLESCLLEIESLVELLCRNLKGPVELLEELVDSVLLVLDLHALECELHDVDCCE